MLPLPRQNAYRDRYKQLRPGWRSSTEDFEGLVRAYLAPATTVLDLGSGRGGTIEAYWREAELAVGVDPDIRSLVERRQPMPVVCAVGEALPFPGGVFDLVSALWVLEHLRSPEQVFREVGRVLKPGGHFVFLTPNARHPLVWVNRINRVLPALQRHLVAAVYEREAADTFRVHYRANSAVEIERLVRQAGLRMVTLRAISDPTYLAFCEPCFQLSVWLERRLPPGLSIHLVGDLVKP